MQLKKMETNFLGRNFLYYKEIDSTQNEIWRLIENQTIQDGTLVMADIQTKGKGTHGRIWHTDEINNIAFSLFVKMDCNIKNIDGITIKIAEIVIEILNKKYGICLKIKHPNDIIYNNKKIGGILTETKTIKENVKYLVVGIGINTSKINFCDDIKDIASSIKKEFNVEVDREEFVSEFCNKFEKEIIKRRNDK